MKKDRISKELAIQNLTDYFNNLHWFWRLFFPKDLANGLILKLSNQKISSIFSQSTWFFHTLIFPALTTFKNKLDEELSNETEKKSAKEKVQNISNLKSDIRQVSPTRVTKALTPRPLTTPESPKDKVCKQTIKNTFINNAATMP